MSIQHVLANSSVLDQEDQQRGNTDSIVVTGADLLHPPVNPAAEAHIERA